MKRAFGARATHAGKYAAAHRPCVRRTHQRRRHRRTHQCRRRQRTPPRRKQHSDSCL